jgi:hypothetical protein
VAYGEERKSTNGAPTFILIIQMRNEAHSDNATPTKPRKKKATPAKE